MILHKNINIIKNDPKFSPRDIKDLTGWFDASDADTITLNGSTVSSWVDKVDNINIDQGTSSLQPTYLVKGRNGKNVVSFFDDFLTHPGAVKTLNFSTVIWAGKLTVDPSAGYFFDFRPSLNESWMIDNNQIGDIFKGTNNIWIDHAVTSQTNESTTKYYTDVWQMNFIKCTGTVSTTNTRFFTRFTEENTGRGDLGEVLFYDRFLTQGERNKIEQYFHEKWNIQMSS